MTVNAIEYPTVRWARELPDHPAVIVDHSPVSYRNLEELIASSAGLLREREVVPGDRVIVCGSNSLEWVVVAHALARLGAVHVPISSRILKTHTDEYQRIYSPRLIISDQASSNLWDHAILIAEFMTRDAEPPRSQTPSEIDPESLHSIVQTSGSEGQPKGVCLSFRNHLSNALGSALNLGVRPDDRWLLNLPLDRIGGIATMIRAAIYGITVVVHDHFNASEVWRSLDEDRVTQLSFVATTLRRVLDAAPGRRCPTHVRSVMVGGGPVPTYLIDEARGRGFPILPTYGLTETSSQIATLSPVASESKQHSAGFPLALAELEIRDDSGATVAAGTEGRIHVRGPMVSEGYWGKDGRVVNILDHDGWFATNDIGSFDHEGYLLVHGRADNVIISGGEKIHAEEIENALTQHPSVARAVVVGIDDDEWGQSPVGFVELAPDRHADRNQLLDYLAERLPRYKLPRRIEILEKIPTLPSGKPDRQSIIVRQRT